MACGPLSPRNPFAEWRGVPLSRLIADYNEHMTVEQRAPRYVHMEVGHVSQNVYLQAEALGLGACAVGAFRDRELATVLGLPERVTPQLVLPVGWPDVSP